MASYSPPYYSTTTTFPPTPNPQNDEYLVRSIMASTAPDSAPFMQPFYDGFNNFGFEGLQATNGGHAQLSGVSSQSGRGHSPVGNGNGRGTRGSSEEKESNLSPSQRRRKEQNRAAQRAFRERKERHVKELESRLASLEQAQSRTVAENDRLKEQLSQTRLENRLLQESRSMNGNSPPEVPEVGPMVFNPTDAAKHMASSSSSLALGVPPQSFTSPIFGAHPNQGPIHRITTSPKTGERLLGTGAAWELIICHPLYEQGAIDIADISDRLKKLARCDGQGPVFEENMILEAIHACSGSSRDELLPDSSSSCSSYSGY